MSQEAGWKISASVGQLTTLLTEIEGILNSRPLVYVGSDVKDGPAITPNHLLGITSRAGFPEVESDDEPDFMPVRSSTDVLIGIWKKGQRLLDQFWINWHNEYLTSLRERVVQSSQRGSTDLIPTVGDVVLIKDRLPRGQWRMGRIISVQPGRDGNIRTARVKLSTGGTLQRSIKLLVPLESQADDVTVARADVQPAHQAEDDQPSTRPKRAAAKLAQEKIRDIHRRECRDERE